MAAHAGIIVFAAAERKKKIENGHTFSQRVPPALNDLRHKHLGKYMLDYLNKAASIEGVYAKRVQYRTGKELQCHFNVFERVRYSTNN